MIKNQIKSILKNIGYKIERVTNVHPLENKYHKLITEVYRVYKHILPMLPDIDEKTITLMTQLDGTQVSEAIYILHYLNSSLELEGDICEFGIAQGLTSMLIAHQLKKTKKDIWLFDSFEGLPKPTKKDILKDDIFNLGTIEEYQGTMAHKPESVLSKMKNILFPLDRVKLVPGFIEETIYQNNLPKKVAFAYVDFDFYEPIKIALNFLDKALSEQGFILVDDYDFFSTGAKTAVDEFVKEAENHFELILPIEGVGHFCILKKQSK